MTAADVADRFYTAFASCDAEAMAACYADDVVFEDPAFGELRGDDARDMWRMLCGRATDLTVTHTVLDATESTVRVNWIATYTYAKGRRVRNDIMATMTIADGLIVDHRDDFDLWAWSRQALGPLGTVLGWSPPMQKKVRSTAQAGLRRYQASR